MSFLSRLTCTVLCRANVAGTRGAMRLHVSPTKCCPPPSFRPRKGKAKGTGYLLLAIPITTFGLGCWQVKRRKWKLGLIKEMDERVTADPLPFPDDLDTLKDWEYYKVRVTGRFDHTQELYVLPRSPIKSSDNPTGMISQGRVETGAHVITPFHVTDRDLRIMVNRGWVPREKIRPETRPEGQVEGEQDLVCFVRHSQKRPPMGVDNDVKKNQWHNRDIEAMSEVLNTAPIFLDADHKSTVPGGPLGGQTRVTLRNDHLSYIFTWYTLCAITLLMWVKRYMPRRA